MSLTNRKTAILVSWTHLQVFLPAASEICVESLPSSCKRIYFFKAVPGAGS